MDLNNKGNSIDLWNLKDQSWAWSKTCPTAEIMSSQLCLLPCLHYFYSPHLRSNSSPFFFVNTKFLLKFSFHNLLPREERIFVLRNPNWCLYLPVSKAESVTDSSCMGNVDCIRSPGPLWVEIEVCTQNSCLRMGAVPFKIASGGNLSLCYWERNGCWIENHECLLNVNLGQGCGVFRGKNKDTESFYCSVCYILWVSFPLGDSLLCIAFSFSVHIAACGC